MSSGDGTVPGLGRMGMPQTYFSESGLKPSRKMDGGCVAGVPVVSRS